MAKSKSSPQKVTASTSLADLKVKDLEQVILAVIKSLGKKGSHANSGPTKHANVPGHANFSKTGRPTKVAKEKVKKPIKKGVHVNSGPTKHANVPGHANFSKTGRPTKVAKAKVKKPIKKGVHVNSGPTKHANRPGHANFS
jgi:hypothetical protein